ncbi:hypothetical protein [Actinomycetospora cinnamomea]|uniref:Uncharacterized protein n=1 Tax=Actinomycetospora cinnamomea TaxID=663609 RepID=A0A2U1FDQ5_9PSEU|nr:hypothetical protein [Actinomycetospora cinnamomea]PVZ10090.1 hypothetical protein C8D89_105166 [Actinomycetospora cinnamomea]
MTDRAGDRTAVTPPQGEPGRPGVVTAAVVLWSVLGVLMIGTALLFGLGLVLGSTEADTGPVAVVAAMVVLAAAGIGTLVAARRLVGGSRAARAGLTVLGAVLAIAGLVQVTFLGVGGVWFVAFVVGAVLLHLPAARAHFRRRP